MAKTTTARNETEFDFAPLDPSTLPVHRRPGRTAVELSPTLLARVRETINANGGVIGTRFYTATPAELAAFNDKAATNAKENDKEFAPLSLVELAERHARKASNAMRPYADAVANENNKAAGLRLVNDGNEENPQVRWAFVLSNKRARKATANGG